MGAIRKIFGGGKKKVDPSNDTKRLKDEAQHDSSRRIKLLKTLGGANGEEVESIKKRKLMGN